MDKSQRKIIDKDGRKYVHESFLNENGEEIGYAEYPYISPEEQAKIDAEIKAQQEAEERARQIEEQKQKMSSEILTQLLLNQAQLTASLREKGVID